MNRLSASTPRYDGRRKVRLYEWNETGDTPDDNHQVRSEALGFVQAHDANVIDVGRQLRLRDAGA